MVAAWIVGTHWKKGTASQKQASRYGWYLFFFLKVNLMEVKLSPFPEWPDFIWIRAVSKTTLTFM